MLSLKHVKYALVFALLASAAPAMAETSKDSAQAAKVPPQLQKMYDRRKADMDPMDTNKDGILQPDELKAGIEAKFKAADTNGDGKISGDEVKQMVTAFEDTNKDTYGSMIKRKGGELEKLMGTKIDKNKDGTVTQDEFTTYYMDHYKSLDKDGDGSLTLKEYRTDVEEPRHRRNNGTNN